MLLNDEPHEVGGEGFNPVLLDYSNAIIRGLDQIERDRIQTLEAIGEYMVDARKEHGEVNLLMVCTHNSRRSHLAQVWMQTAGYYYGLDDLHNWSGGTEATAANRRAMVALRRAGFSVMEDLKKEDNQRYLIRQGEGFKENRVFSKVYDHEVNPATDFGAIMVCSDADKNCPFIPGAEQRFSLPFMDPKHADGTPDEKEAYDLACFTIAREMFYIARFVKEHTR